MKRKIILSIALALGVAVLALIKFGSTVNAEPPQRFQWDTGIVTLGENQILRVVSVSVDGELGGGVYGEVIRRIEYQQTGCEAGICKHTIAAQSVSPLLTHASNEAISIDTPNGGTRRIVGLTNNRNARINSIVFDTATQRVVAVTQIPVTTQP